MNNAVAHIKINTHERKILVYFKWACFIAATYFGFKAFTNFSYYGFNESFTLLFFVACTAGLMWAGRRISSKQLLGNEPAKGWVAQFPNARYSHYGNNTGIALDDQTRTIHLLEGKLSKSYSYNDVRSWNTNVQTGGVVYGGGLAGVFGTLEAAKGNNASTGLFIIVKDIEHPEWKINFYTRKNRDLRKTHAKWLEILTQSINSDIPETLRSAKIFSETALNNPRPIGPVSGLTIDLAKSGSKMFCPECGAPNTASSKFCKKCGETL